MAIYSSTVECLKLFQASQPTLASEHDSFRTWSANIGAFQRGRFSLDARLRDSSDIKTVVLDLLRKLADAIRTVIDLESTAQDQTNDKKSFDSSSSSDGDVLLHLVGKTSILERTTSRIRAIINSLMRLSISIRDPAPLDRYRRSKKIDVSEFVPYDTEHVEQLFPNLETFLKERLVNAILARRQFLEYSTIQHSRYARDYDALSLQENDKIADDQSLGAQTRTSETLSTLPPPSNFDPSFLDKLNLRSENEQSDASSVTSYASSTGNSGRPKVPPPPEDAELGGDPFECPYCYLLVEVQNMHDWKRHVYHDLQPYVCTFEHCNEPDRLFQKRHQWFEHELEYHRKEYICIKGCGRSFSDLSSFRTHVNTNHPEVQQTSVNELHSGISLRRIGPDAVSSCPFSCDDLLVLDSRKKIEKHIGNHQMHLALRALGTIVQDTNTSESSSESGSVTVVEKEPNLGQTELKTPENSSNVEDLSVSNVDKEENWLTFNVIIGISNKFQIRAPAIMDTGSQPNMISSKILAEMKLQYPQFAPDPTERAHQIVQLFGRKPSSRASVELDWTLDSNEPLTSDVFYVCDEDEIEVDVLVGWRAFIAKDMLTHGPALDNVKALSRSSAKLASSSTSKLFAQNRVELSKPPAERTSRWMIQSATVKLSAVKLGQIYHDPSMLEDGHILTGKVSPGYTTSFREHFSAQETTATGTWSAIRRNVATILGVDLTDRANTIIQEVKAARLEIKRMDSPMAYLLDNEGLRQQLFLILARKSSKFARFVLNRQDKKNMLFMITGIMIAHDVVMVSSTRRGVEAKIPVAQAAIAAAAGVNVEAESSSKTEYRSTEPVLFACQWHQIRLDRKSRLQTQHIKSEDHNHFDFYA